MDRSNMQLFAVLLFVLALIQVATPESLCLNTCPTPDGKTVCAYNGCFFNTEFCTIKTFNCHRQVKGMSVVKVVSEGVCNNETQTPYCTTVTF
ncbi:uncharacterized protein LOC121404138 [Drosophila obscura]|uniref:uncharacterized protein LOC121404138 n=1 Tax=Drosophila obscura TaxID=7282 RepID=UPI001BB2407E|nr:uncharacterized protein LOC121404138 [Drosophila obscura]